MAALSYSDVVMSQQGKTLIAEPSVLQNAPSTAQWENHLPLRPMGRNQQNMVHAIEVAPDVKMTQQEVQALVDKLQAGSIGDLPAPFGFNFPEGSTKTAELQFALVPEPGKVDVYTLVKWINCKEKVSRKEVLGDHILFPFSATRDFIPLASLPWKYVLPRPDFA